MKNKRNIIDKLRINNRYFFYDDDRKWFRATVTRFLQDGGFTYVNRIILEKIKNGDGVISIPLDFIPNVFCLSDILFNKSIIPDEILNIIDEYL